MKGVNWLWTISASLLLVEPSWANLPVAHRHNAVLVAQGNATMKAQQLFQQYVTLMNNFDPGILNLYDKNAQIIMIRRSQQGDRTMTLSFAEYKELMISSLPLAKSRGDRSTFSNVTYKSEGNRVRIQAQRYSQIYRNTNPHTLLVGPDATGKWVIFEEIIEAQR